MNARLYRLVGFGRESTPARLKSMWILTEQLLAHHIKVTQNEDFISLKAVISGSGNREVTSRLEPASPKVVSWFGQFLRLLGPGLITGAADDDPSGIATYAQVGAQFGPSMLWTMPFVYPFMAAIQEISARLGRVTGHAGLPETCAAFTRPGCYMSPLPCSSLQIQSILGRTLGRWVPRSISWSEALRTSIVLYSLLFR